MLLVADVKRDLRLPVDWEAFRESDGDLIAFAARPRSTLPAITHVDHSARVQTVDAARNAGFHRLLSAFHRRTGCPVLVNTSFNVRGEPIVCTPQDAIRCFLNTELDLLAIGEFLVWKRDQSDELRSLEGSIAFDPD
jgi:carbamoyltransferase